MNANKLPQPDQSTSDQPMPTKGKRGRPSIQDEFTNLPVSRQRKWQLRQIAQGGCRICGQPATSVGLCLKHMVKEREHTAARFGYKRKNEFCKSRLLEKLAAGSGSKQWRYQIISARADGLDLTAASQEVLVKHWGALGWELTSAAAQPDGDILFYFKQPVNPLQAFAI